MTTKNSPLRRLKQQADNMAKMLKAAERGETVANDPAGKIAAARKRDSITFGIVMDDKVIQVTMAWATIKETSEAGISEYIVSYMREENRDKPN